MHAGVPKRVNLGSENLNHSRTVRAERDRIPVPFLFAPTAPSILPDSATVSCEQGFGERSHLAG
jgi:hypothetical protein